MSNELQLTRGPYTFTSAGIEIARESTPDEWERYGEGLRLVDEARQWAIGDWLVDGKRHYGDGLYKRASELTGLDEGSLRNMKSAAEIVELSLRNDRLSWNHHKELASLKTIRERKDGTLELSDETDYEKIAALLAESEKTNLSVRALRDKVQQYKRRQTEEIRLANEPQKYSVILADPAWEYDFAQSDSRQIGNHYEPSPLKDMQQLRVPAADNCILFLWATSPKLPEAMALIDSWGFAYKTCAVWVKDKIGMGYYFRQKHELVLIATKGTVGTPNPENRVPSVFEAPRTEHSEKPEYLYTVIEAMYPEYNKLEMFARSTRAGWDSWGDET